jgi:DNA-binding IclR family transcriptional regulator
VTEQDRVLAALEAGHKNAVAITKATGLTYQEVRNALTRLRVLRLIEHELSGCGTYRLADRCLLAEVWTGVAVAA